MTKHVAIILGSTRPTRISPEIAKWAQNILNQGSIQYDIIDLKKVNLPFLDEEEMPMTGKYHKQHTLQWSKTIKSYDGIIFLFPQYNWGYPAVLKNAIDYLGKEWQNKPVSCITYGFHGGAQSYASMLLVMSCLKMKRMAVNPSISISQRMFNGSSFIDIDKDLKPYVNDIKLLHMNFVNILE
ncbi:NADPH-dependent FMN reductase [Acetilactobacillus jinshanensis]|uniref:NADPH-dependent oxidoreductase n=1 Tax=Acetilactobacillus jinshanensis TaxID=1720083 RepID=A0A4P6ZLL1_9LACO|nr:NAD(P)H-dependent oxidoreductase [Acetilactobacillus jinshanensis]QBP18578.1 NADPH-dependent oxidoreductase [Acetilactobacillus jinshanensis]URL61454.1 NAD(P)H-dependent oxidoreductase [uncultured bacterium]